MVLKRKEKLTEYNRMKALKYLIYMKENCD